MRNHAANIVTASRGLAGPVVAGLVYTDRLDLAFALFIIAIASDLLDGWLARQLNATSKLGQWLDPMSDKLLTDTCWLALWASGRCPAWLAIASLLRDGVVIAAWTWQARRGRRWAPSAIGQVMVAFEGVAIPVLLFPHRHWLGVHWLSVGVVIGGITLTLSALSLLEYAWRGPSESGTW